MKWLARLLCRHSWVGAYDQKNPPHQGGYWRCARCGKERRVRAIISGE